MFCVDCGHLESRHNERCCSQCYCLSRGFSAVRPNGLLVALFSGLARLMFGDKLKMFKCRDCGVQLPDSKNYCCQDINGVMRSEMCKSCMFAFAAGPNGRKAAAAG